MNRLLLWLFLVINFGALTLWWALQWDWATSEWYMSLARAPWTPPGWVFWFAWTLIMICFSIYLARLFSLPYWWSLIVLYVMHLILNIAWSYTFFVQHDIVLALIIISLLFVTVLIFAFAYHHLQWLWTWLLAPYIVWLCIAISLNAYVL